jgi:acyl dehydratase
MIPPVKLAPHAYDDLAPGMAFRSGPRQVTRADIADFARLSGDHTRLHSDDAYAAGTPFGGVVAHGALNLAVATGLAWASGLFEGTVLAVVSMDIAFERPVFPGDSVTLLLRVSRLDPRPRQDRGRVAFEVDLENQAGKRVLSGTWSLLLRRQPVPGPGRTAPPD